jgi:hypothetical protein
MAMLRVDGMKTCAAAIDAERPMVARREERSDEESRSPPVALRSVTQHSAAHTARPSSDRFAIEAAMRRVLLLRRTRASGCRARAARRVTDKRPAFVIRKAARRARLPTPRTLDENPGSEVRVCSNSLRLFSCWALSRLRLVSVSLQRAARVIRLLVVQGSRAVAAICRLRVRLRGRSDVSRCRLRAPAAARCAAIRDGCSARNTPSEKRGHHD